MGDDDSSTRRSEDSITARGEIAEELEIFNEDQSFRIAALGTSTDGRE